MKVKDYDAKKTEQQCRSKFPSSHPFLELKYTNFISKANLTVSTALFGASYQI